MVSLICSEILEGLQIPRVCLATSFPPLHILPTDRINSRWARQNDIQAESEIPILACLLCRLVSE